MLSGKIAKRYGAEGLPDDTITLNLTGSTGQSFMAFGMKGITINLTGDCNDYVGKGLSGATAVVEGTGDHGCEYMTGGRVVVLGRTGKNFAAGMSGGVAYVLDENNDLYMKTNKELVSTEELSNKYNVQELKKMLEEHVKYTNSVRGKEILENFEEYLPKFKKIIPHDYQAMLQAIAQMEEKGLSNEQAQIEAFYQLKKAR